MKAEIITYSLLGTLFSLCCIGACIRGKEVAERHPIAKFNKIDFSIPCTEFPLERATTYWCDSAQCDSNPYTTADGSIIDPNNPHRWCALSRDLLTRWGGEFDYGDTIEIYSNEHPNLDGYWVIHDCMNAKYKMSIDFLMHPKDNTPKLGIGSDIKIISCGDN